MPCNVLRMGDLVAAPQAHRTPSSADIAPNPAAALASMIQVSPNPFNDFILIEGKGLDMDVTYRVFNQVGQQVAVEAGNLSMTAKLDLNSLDTRCLPATGTKCRWHQLYSEDCEAVSPFELL